MADNSPSPPETPPAAASSTDQEAPPYEPQYIPKPRVGLPAGVRLIPMPRADGVIEMVDHNTGKVVMVHPGINDPIKRVDHTQMIPVLGPTGEITLVYPDAPTSLSVRHWQNWTRDEVLEDLICRDIVHGATIEKIGKTPGYPPLAILSRWLQDPGFKEKVAAARAFRAEILKDQVLEDAEEVVRSADPDDFVAAAKMRQEAKKWVAQVDSPERFGNRTKVDATVQASVIVIDTGIRRDDALDVTGTVGEAKLPPVLDGGNTSGKD